MLLLLFLLLLLCFFVVDDGFVVAVVIVDDGIVVVVVVVVVVVDVVEFKVYLVLYCCYKVGFIDRVFTILHFQIIIESYFLQRNFFGFAICYKSKIKLRNVFYKFLKHNCFILSEVTPFLIFSFFNVNLFLV